MTLSTGHSKFVSILVLGLAFGAFALAGPVKQAEATHTTGFVAAGEAVCLYDGKVHVFPPEVSPANPTGYPQKVAVRVSLAEKTGSGWTTVVSDVWKTTTATNAAIAQYTWKDLSGNVVNGWTQFHGLKQGQQTNRIQYRVFTEYFWYPDAYRPASGYLSQWNPHKEYRGSSRDQKTYDRCDQPGPNDIVIIG